MTPAKRAAEIGRRIENAVLVVLLVALVALACGQIVLRNLFSVGIVWADGLIRLLVLWLALLGAVAASGERRHIAIDALIRVLPERARLAADALRGLFAAAVCALLARYSWSFVADSRAFGDLLLDGLPAWWFQLILPAGFALMACRFMLGAVRAAREAL